jgi:hypothetical protein
MHFYAKRVLEGRFELGEPIIATSSEYVYHYARDVIKGRFELGEPVILKYNAIEYKTMLKNYNKKLK